jgi:allophanate hydrolase subunit 1
LDADYHSEYTVPSQTKYVQEQASATFYDIAPEIQQATLTTRAMAMIDKIVDQEALPIHQIIPQVRTPSVTVSHSFILNWSLASSLRAYIAFLGPKTGMR